MIIRAAERSDFPAVLMLNEESVRFLSPLPLPRLEMLHGAAALHLVAEVAGAVRGFVLAFRERAVYDSINYRWFDQRYDRFLYVDRVVVAQTAQGQGIGAELYRQVFAAARLAGVPWVTCEFDIDPPNEASAHFHARFGFGEVGRQPVAEGGKWVSLRAARIAD
jgi:hypothetical protein